MSELLHYKIDGEGHPIVLIHGLFGTLDNLGGLARTLKNDWQVIQIDLRNHGRSFHSETHDYLSMAQDVVALLSHLSLSSVTLIGHSMGGKVAMKVATLIPEHIKSLVIMDIAPVQYTERRHDNVFDGLFAVLEQKPTTREEVMHILRQHIEMPEVTQFLGKSLYRNGDVMAFRFNVQSLYDNYQFITGWENVPPVCCPTLFLKGGHSDYITQDAQDDIRLQFPKAKAHIISNTGHWLHAEKPADVSRVIQKFLQNH